MSDERARAREIAKTWARREAEIGPMVLDIEQALREERRRVWEEAAQHCRTDACGIDIHDPFVKGLAEYFQYRADHEQFGPAWERNKQQTREEAT